MRRNGWVQIDSQTEVSTTCTVIPKYKSWDPSPGRTVNSKVEMVKWTTWRSTIWNIQEKEGSIPRGRSHTIWAHYWNLQEAGNDAEVRGRCGLNYGWKNKSRTCDINLWPLQFSACMPCGGCGLPCSCKVDRLMWFDMMSWGSRSYSEAFEVT